MRTAPALFAALGLLTGLIAPAGDARAQQDPIVIDVGRALEEARRDRTVLAPMAEDISAAMEAQVAATIRLGEDEWIRTPNVPVRVSVSGVFGDWTAECNIAFTFQRKSLGDDRYAVQINSMSGGLTAAYEYGKGQGGMEIANFVASPLSSEPSPFVTGDLILRPDCGSGPLSEQETATPALVQQYQRQAEACVLAFQALGFYVASRDLPPPPECVELTYLTQVYASRIGLNKDTVATLQRCTPAIAGGFGDERLIDPSCARQIEAIGKQVSAGLGLCDLAGLTSANLRIIDPDPYGFKALYTLSHQRADCKTYTVNAVINGTKPDFSFMAVLPVENQCLVVEQVNPRLQVFFNRQVREDGLDQKLRLRTEHGGSEETVPASISQPSPGMLELVPDDPLVPSARYALEIRDGKDGIESEEGDVIDTIPGLRRNDDNFVRLTHFHAAPYSDRAAEGSKPELDTGVYQVSRDEPLIRRRPVATRVWFDWDSPHDQPGRFATSFCAEVDVVSAGSGEKLYPTLDFDFRPNAAHDAEQKRQGKDTANLFNWRPKDAEPAIEVRVRPREYWSGASQNSADAPPELKKSRPVAFQPDEPASLTLIYGYLPVYDFLDGIPAELEAQVQRNMLNVRTYLWQNFPIEKTTIRYVGAVSLPDLGIVENPKTLHLTESDYIFNMATAYFGRAHCRVQHVVCILFLPPVNRFHADKTKREHGRTVRASTYVYSLNIDTMDGAYSMASDGAGLAHEVAHSFGLSHLPNRVADKEDYREYLQEGGIFPDIDGIRMHRSGQGGRIKSSETGNSEDTNFLAPLMYPTVVGEPRQFMTNTHYRQLIQSIYNPGTPAEGFGPGTLGELVGWERATYDTIRDRLKRSRVTFFGQGSDDEAYQQPRPSLVLGRQDAGAGPGRPAIMLPLVARFGPEGIELTPTGSPELHTVAIEDNYHRATGDVFTLRLGWSDGRSREQSFTVARSTQLRSLLVDLFLPIEGEFPSDYVIFDARGTEIARYAFGHVPEELPGLGMETLSDGTARLFWDETAPVRVRVDFLPDADHEPVPIGLKAAAGEFRFDPAELGGQGNGRLSLTFLNGLTERSFELPVELKNPFLVRTQTSEGEPFQPDVVLTFNRPLESDLPGFLLETEVGERLPLAASSQGDQLILYPLHPLEPCQAYRIVADGPLRDHTRQAMQGRFERRLEVGGTDCARSPVGARLVQTINGGTQEFDGRASMMEDGTVRLEFDRLTLFVQLPSGDAADLVLARAERGPGRRDLTLSYSNDGSGPGTASIIRTENSVSGRFQAVVNESVLDGSFAVRN